MGASLILRVTNVMLLIWVGECIYVITIISYFPQLIGDVASWTCRCRGAAERGNYVYSGDRWGICSYSRIYDLKINMVGCLPI